MSASLRVATVATLAAVLGACATTTPPAASNTNAAGQPATAAAPTAAAPAAPAAAAPAAAPRPAADPQGLRPFAEVIKDAKENKGYFGLWTKDDRTWLEIAPEQLDKPFFFGYSLASGLGERFFLPGLMGAEQVVVFRRVGNNVQMIARNLRVRAPTGTPLESAVRESYSDSLLATAPVVSAPHGERKSFLIDAAALVGNDLPGAQTALEAAFRLSYGFDRNNSQIERARTTEQGTFLTYRAHFALPKLPAPPVTPPPPGTPQVPPPRVLPDNRSLFLSFAYTFAPLPAEPMKARVADQRVGHFTTAFWDFGNPTSGDSRTHFVERWRLEKKDPKAAVSEPKEPILVWMDKNIPEAYREAVKSGILEWNKAFEKAGFKDAIVVKQQPADADWSTVEGTRHLAVRWFAMQGPGAVAVGPSQSDPRTGEILRGAAIIPDNWVRLSRARIADQQIPLPPPAASLTDMLNGRACTYASGALEQAAFGFELLVARGELDPMGADAERFIAEALKDVTMHEVGHALGLRHNFKASTGVKLEQLRDAAFTRNKGISNSVMDYNALNIPLAGEKASTYNQVTLGEYDYWAIEYAYKEIAPEQEKAELAKIAARSANNPNLAYATDEDSIGAIDPTANQFDLGNDPLGYYKRNFALIRELWTRTQQRKVTDGDNLAVNRRNLLRGLDQIGRTLPLITKYIGGSMTSREVANGSGAPVLFAPVPAQRQREALGLLTQQIFAADSFRFDPAFMSRLGVDQLDRFLNADAPVVNTDFSIASSVLNLQRTVLDQLMSDNVAARLADAEAKVVDRRQLLTFAEVQSQLADAIWSELKSGRDIDSVRRNLQREHLKRVATGLVRPISGVAADVRAVNRQTALRLQADLRQALAKGTWSPIARAHLTESLAVIDEALKAPVVRQAI